MWLELFDERVGRLGQFQFGPTVESPLSQALFPTSPAYGIPVFEKDLVGTVG